MKIQGFSNYEIYPQEGKIWSYKRNRFIGNKRKDGYWECTLYGDDGAKWHTTLHRVIWIAVNGTIPQGLDVNHIDENPSNNIISNLNLMTRMENLNYGTRNERASKTLTNRTDLSKAIAAFKDGQLIMIFPSTRDAERNGYNQGSVSACCRNCFNREGNNIYKGYQWRYI